MSSKTIAPSGLIKPTIGLFSETLQFAYSINLLQGVRDAVTARDANLLCFVGGRLYNLEDLGKEATLLYTLMGAENIDGVLFVTTVFRTCSDKADILKLRQQYAPLPQVSIGFGIEGISGVTVDNYVGMYQAVEHLIVAHNCRQIACIRGPEHHQEADSRYEAYVNALKDHGLSFNESLVVVGDFLPSDVRQAVEVLLDHRRVQFDAIVAANDNMALGASKALQQRGICIPQDIAVTGFDDFIEA